MRISLQTLLEIEAMHNPGVQVRNENAMRGVCSQAIRCHEPVAGGKQFGRSRNNIEASIEYGMLPPHMVGAGRFTNESRCASLSIGCCGQDALEIVARGRPALPIPTLTSTSDTTPGLRRTDVLTVNNTFLKP
jgi:hypothetical protein